MGKSRNFDQLATVEKYRVVAALLNQQDLLRHILAGSVREVSVQSVPREVRGFPCHVQSQYVLPKIMGAQRFHDLCKQLNRLLEDIGYTLSDLTDGSIIIIGFQTEDDTDPLMVTPPVQDQPGSTV